LLVSRVIHRDFGIPATPHIEMVESRWIDGTTLRCSESRLLREVLWLPLPAERFGGIRRCVAA